MTTRHVQNDLLDSLVCMDLNVCPFYENSFYVASDKRKRDLYKSLKRKERFDLLSSSLNEVFFKQLLSLILRKAFDSNFDVAKVCFICLGSMIKTVLSPTRSDELQKLLQKEIPFVFRLKSLTDLEGIFPNPHIEEAQFLLDNVMVPMTKIVQLDKITLDDSLGDLSFLPSSVLCEADDNILDALTAVADDCKEMPLLLQNESVKPLHISQKPLEDHLIVVSVAGLIASRILLAIGDANGVNSTAQNTTTCADSVYLQASSISTWLECERGIEQPLQCISTGVSSAFFEDVWFSKNFDERLTLLRNLMPQGSSGIDVESAGASKARREARKISTGHGILISHILQRSVSICHRLLVNGRITDVDNADLVAMQNWLCKLDLPGVGGAIYEALALLEISCFGGGLSWDRISIMRNAAIKIYDMWLTKLSADLLSADKDATKSPKKKRRGKKLSASKGDRSSVLPLPLQRTGADEEKLEDINQKPQLTPEPSQAVVVPVIAALAHIDTCDVFDLDQARAPAVREPEKGGYLESLQKESTSPGLVISAKDSLDVIVTGECANTPKDSSAELRRTGDKIVNSIGDGVGVNSQMHSDVYTEMSPCTTEYASHPREECNCLNAEWTLDKGTDGTTKEHHVTQISNSSLTRCTEDRLSVSVSERNVVAANTDARADYQESVHISCSVSEEKAVVSQADGADRSNAVRTDALSTSRLIGSDAVPRSRPGSAKLDPAAVTHRPLSVPRRPRSIPRIFTGLLLQGGPESAPLDLLRIDKQLRLAEQMSRDILHMSQLLTALSVRRRQWQSTAVDGVRSVVNSLWAQVIKRSLNNQYNRAQHIVVLIYSLVG